MPTGRTCGNCQNFVRIKSFDKQGYRKKSGICQIYDYNCNVDGAYAKKCNKYKRSSAFKNSSRTEANTPITGQPPSQD